MFLATWLRFRNEDEVCQSGEKVDAVGHAVEALISAETVVRSRSRTSSSLRDDGGRELTCGGQSGARNTEGAVPVLCSCAGSTGSSGGGVSE